MNRWNIGTILLIALGRHAAFAQVDSTVVEDSILQIQHYKEILEQSSDASPLLDDLTTLDQGSQNELKVSLRTRLSQKLQQSAGYNRGIYLGSSSSFYDRMTFVQGEHFSGGLLLAKDGGEQRLTDFTSGYISGSHVFGFSNVILGDYRVEVGQGIALWRGYDFSKGSDVIAPVWRHGRGLTSPLSSDETAFFRGVAAEVSSAALKTAVFYSQRSLSSSLDANGSVTSLYTSGYFRTTGEQSKRNNLTEKLYGFHAAYFVHGNENVGITIYRAQFNRNLLIDDGKRFSGNGYTLLAADYNVSSGSTMLFGEWATMNQVVGGISGVLFTPTHEIQVISAVRVYPYRLFSLHGLGFGERATTSNEAGMYLGVHLKLPYATLLTSYIDQFKFPEGTSSSKFSMNGNELFMEVENHSFRKSTITVRYQRKSFQTVGSNSFSVMTDLQRLQRVRLQGDFRLTTKVQLRGRIEKVFLDWKYVSRNEQGTLVYYDLFARPTGSFKCNLRILLFRTDSYDTRIAEYERDLDGVLSLPLLYGSGIRWYFLVNYRIADHFEIFAKYSDTIRDDVKHIGSGLDELPTNRDNRVSIQLDLQL